MSPSLVAGAEATFGLAKPPSENQTTLAQQERQLRELKEQFARLPPDPPPSPAEAADVRERREKKAKVGELLRAIERRIAEENGAEPVPAKASEAFEEYYERLKARVEREAKENPPIGRGIGGKVLVTLTIGASGEIESLTTENASSVEFSEYTVSLLRRMAPFEPLSDEMRKRVDRIVITGQFSCNAP